ncbi:MAG: alpha/beta hydrolase [Kordiimonadales bacterium]|nr:MAG: alpha/beta hydrolase [Kordiimonadales bacterium]
MKNLLIALLAVLAGSHAAIAGNPHSFDVKVSGKGPVMIMIPGLNSAGATWDTTVEKYRGSYQTHVLTLPGFAGQAETISENFTQSMRDEIIQYIRSENIEQPILVGHSLGGFLALQIAIAEPSLTSKLVIVDSLPFLPAIMIPGATLESTAPMAQQMRSSMQAQSQEEYKKTAHQYLGNMTNSAEKTNLIFEWGVASSRKVSGQAMYELFTTDLRDDIAAIKTPTLVLGAWIAFKNYGATRENTLAKYEAQYAKLKNAKVVMTDIGKHFIMWDDPDFFFGEIDRFLKG